MCLRQRFLGACGGLVERLPPHALRQRRGGPSRPPIWAPMVPCRIFFRIGRRTADQALSRPSAHGRAAPSVTVRAELTRRTRSVRPGEPPLVASRQSTRRTAAAISDLPAAQGDVPPSRRLPPTSK
jgi:hypothetical protein